MHLMCEKCRKLDATIYVHVVLATSIPRETCDRINLGYIDPSGIRLSDYADREEEGILFVDHAGEILYRLKQA